MIGYQPLQNQLPPKIVVLESIVILRINNLRSLKSEGVRASALSAAEKKSVNQGMENN